ncbi:phage regulatory protein [Muribacter muris]|uniref:Phage regulatory protein n=1 Tax=Muribacter muris TaxID=67855 RepID=A0A4Y9K2K1_9PAST|nr:Rha family transcriptional regulator [Muribacter muris]MBF0784464.1 Rha family transcriptional regulator [Muribacter muris]MBF0826240.1 Rha family transcriptional regulator [Muribacter muris]TFV11978.1 phage regulatory protein [Muribacter muris]
MTKLLNISERKSSIRISSVEIAQLCEKRHDNVMADIRNMLEQLKIQSPEFLGDYTDSRGRTYSCYFLPKREAMILISGYRIDLRAKIIDRLDELEKQLSDPLPKSLPDALRKLADEVERNTVLELENQQKSLQIQSMESYFRNGISPFEFVKGLNGVNSLKIGEFLVSKNWLYQDTRDQKRVKAYARDLYLTEENIEINPHGQEPFLSYKPVLLKKGAAKLYEWYTQGTLPMKKNWNGEFTSSKAVGL